MSERDESSTAKDSPLVPALVRFGVLVLAIVLLAIGLARWPARAPSGFSGLEFTPLTRAAAARVPTLKSRGVLVASVYRLGPADEAGVKAGEVVTRIDGRAVGSAAGAADIVREKKPGEQITLTVVDIAQVKPKARTIVVTVAAERPDAARVFMVRPPRVLAHEWRFGPAMTANASWSRRIARGPVDPHPLVLYRRGRCSALAPTGWAVAAYRGDGRSFSIRSTGGHVQAIYRVVPLASPADRQKAIGDQIAAALGQRPSLAPPLAFGQEFALFEFGTPNNYAGFVLSRLDRTRQGLLLSLRIAAVPAAQVADLERLAGAVLLSIRCTPALAGDAVLSSSTPPTAVSARCLQGACDESDLAGAFNEKLHMGYVHAADGENFLIDPRKDIWAMGPSGRGTYRQVAGTLELLEPGRTN